MKQQWSFLVSTALIVGMVACTKIGDDSQQQEEYDYRSILEHYADEVIHPSFMAFHSAAHELRDSADNFCGLPSADGLTRIQNLWLATAKSWAITDPFGFGPVDTLRFGDSIHFWPARTEKIDGYLIDGDLQQEAIASGSTLIRGLPVLEYLLFGSAENPTTYDQYQTGDRRCTYLLGLTNALLADAGELEELWAPSSGTFYSSFVEAGTDKTAFAKQKQAFDVLVNQMILTVQKMEDRKVARPAGKRTQGVPQPQDVESPFALASRELLLANLQGIETALLGGDGLTEHSLGKMILNQEEKTWLLLEEKVQSSQSALTSQGTALATEVVDNPTAAEELFQSLKDLFTFMSQDMADILEVTPTLSGDDGD